MEIGGGGCIADIKGGRFDGAKMQVVRGRDLTLTCRDMESHSITSDIIRKSI